MHGDMSRCLKEKSLKIIFSEEDDEIEDLIDEKMNEKG